MVVLVTRSGVRDRVRARDEGSPPIAERIAELDRFDPDQELRLAIRPS